MALALIAGSGNLPLQIIQSCVNKGKPLLVIGFEGQTTLEKNAYTEFSLGAIGKILEHLKTNNIQEIVFAGGIRRPAWSELDLDWVGMKWFKTLGFKALKGDNDLLSGILDLLKQEGFNIIKPGDLLDNLMSTTGILTTTSPSESALADIERGLVILNSLSSADVGQAVIVQQGLVLGIEAIEGTAALIDRCSALKRSGGGVLVKIAKTGQSQDVDLPTIGPDTIRQIKAAGFAGIALGARNTQIIDYDETIRLANEYNLFIVGV